MEKLQSMNDSYAQNIASYGTGCMLGHKMATLKDHLQYFEIQSTLDISNSDISNSAKLKASI